MKRLTALKSLLDLGDVELVSVASSRLAEHQHEPAIQEIQAALTDHRYEEAVRMIEKLLSDAYPKFVGMRAGEERDWEIAPGVKMTFCWCPPGEFMMGGPETYQVYVTLTKGFWMAKTQVMPMQWVAIMGDKFSQYKSDNLPVESVSWDNAQEFINKLNAKIGNSDGGQMVLPTEAQWEYACKAGDLSPYSGTINEVAWYRDNSGNRTHQVGIKDTNAWGLNDMRGNIQEWCNDWYCFSLSDGVDPSGPDSGTYRVLRGGGRGRSPGFCSATFDRIIGLPWGTYTSGGFRVARCSAP